MGQITVGTVGHASISRHSLHPLIAVSSCFFDWSTLSGSLCVGILVPNRSLSNDLIEDESHPSPTFYCWFFENILSDNWMTEI